MALPIRTKGISPRLVIDHSKVDPIPNTRAASLARNANGDNSGAAIGSDSFDCVWPDTRRSFRGVKGELVMAPPFLHTREPDQYTKPFQLTQGLSSSLEIIGSSSLFEHDEPCHWRIFRPMTVISSIPFTAHDPFPQKLETPENGSR
ncbi:MAG: hypothetical protein FWC56_02740 [Phycisphaerae bacterium]|nr:hypothetical protein [Phycisphaerae bacterium]